MRQRQGAGAPDEMMQNEPPRASEPMFNVPGGVTLAAAIMLVMQIVRDLLPDVESLELLLALAFIPARYDGAALELPGGYLTAVTSFVTYMIVHSGWVHLLVNLLWMVAFGTAVARRIGGRRFFAFSILCGIAGALVHLALHFGELAPVVGASAAISGQMAAALRFVFSAQARGGWRSPDLAKVPLESLGQTLTDVRIVTILVLWILINALFGFGAITLAGAEGQIAWEAHIGGFLFGLVTFGFFDQRAEPVPTPAA